MLWQNSRSARSDPHPTSVVLADDSLLVREGIARVLEEAGLRVAGQTDNVDELLSLVDRLIPRIAIVDIRLQPGQVEDGVQAALRIRTGHPSVAVLILSQYLETGYVEQLFAEGAAGIGYLMKDNVIDPREFIDAVRRVADGGSAIDTQVVDRMVHRQRRSNALDELTDRQRVVLSLIAEGRTNRAIGDVLHLTPKTVEAHIRAIFARLDLPQTADDHRRVLAVLAYLQLREPALGPDCERAPDFH